MKDKEIQNTATKIRKDFKENRIQDKILMDLYHVYNPDVDSRVFVHEAKKIFPKLNCGLASVYLKKILGAGEVVQGKYLENNHTFLKISKNKILDITADQYGGPKVYYGELKFPWQISKGKRSEI